MARLSHAASRLAPTKYLPVSSANPDAGIHSVGLGCATVPSYLQQGRSKSGKQFDPLWINAVPHRGI